MPELHVAALVRRLENHEWKGVSVKGHEVHVSLQGKYPPTVERELREHAQAICDALRGKRRGLFFTVHVLSAKPQTLAEEPRPSHAVLYFSSR